MTDKQMILRMKIFSHWSVEDLEESINEWLALNPLSQIDIREIHQSQSESRDSGSITVSIWYRGEAQLPPEQLEPDTD